MLLAVERTDLASRAFLAECGEIFSLFDAATQDSGNISYGLRLADERFFVKTAGSLSSSASAPSFDERVTLLRNAARLAGSVSDPALPALRHVVESAEGPLLVYDWVDGELLRAPVERRLDPESSFQRFLRLPVRERTSALDSILRVHVKLCALGLVACDFYDGSLIYDFARRVIHLVDLDHYRAPFINETGRLPGSTRFMAPEEFTPGARIDERTTVFTLGRALEQFLPDVDAARALALQACHPDPEGRFRAVADFEAEWARVTKGWVSG